MGKISDGIKKKFIKKVCVNKEMNFKSLTGETRMIKDIGRKLTELQAILIKEFGFPCRIVFMGEEVKNSETFNNLSTLGPKGNSATVVQVKICLSCSLYNKKTDTKCELCDAPLPPAADGNQKPRSPKKPRSNRTKSTK